MVFKFKFATLLNVRKIQEDMAQQVFSQAQRYVRTLYVMKEQVSARRDILRAELMTRMRQGLSAIEVKGYYDYLDHLEQGIERINENIKTAERQVDEQREEFLKAKRSFKAIARLKEIHQARFDETERKKDMNFLDEIAILKAGGER
ncbi:MAG TPA: flagellar export protein FliJ [Desulfomonilia bacterium]|nr:flagellar export protein FliJ [Desulfomonilia bacterium]